MSKKIKKVSKEKKFLNKIKKKDAAWPKIKHKKYKTIPSGVPDEYAAQFE